MRIPPGSVFQHVALTTGMPLPSRGPDGKLKEVRKLKLEEGSPDGMEIDADGNLWVAIADQDFVACYAPDSGQPFAPDLQVDAT